MTRQCDVRAIIRAIHFSKIVNGGTLLLITKQFYSSLGLNLHSNCFLDNLLFTLGITDFSINILSAKAQDWLYSESYWWKFNGYSWNLGYDWCELFVLCTSFPWTNFEVAFLTLIFTHHFIGYCELNCYSHAPMAS